MNIKRTVRCTKCGSEFTLNIETTFPVSEIMVTGKCPTCGTMLQINFETIESGTNTEENTTEIEKKEEKGFEDIEAQFPTEAMDALSEIMNDE